MNLPHPALGGLPPISKSWVAGNHAVIANTWRRHGRVLTFFECLCGWRLRTFTASYEEPLIDLEARWHLDSGEVQVPAVPG
ncbi:hypothetical protein [Streptosporangium sp. NPDC002524]|uniref:hypothetical protein n=1 Tax=Streptosporangium sp. NPDC002524 TaxID=3154537 RepID=UPI00331DADAB